jgi:hypothetical protein
LLDDVVVEVKAASLTGPAEQAQVLNSLISGRRLGLLLNFGRPSLATSIVVDQEVGVWSSVQSAVAGRLAGSIDSPARLHPLREPLSWPSRLTVPNERPWPALAEERLRPDFAGGLHGHGGLPFWIKPGDPGRHQRHQHGKGAAARRRP